MCPAASASVCIRACHRDPSPRASGWIVEMGTLKVSHNHAPLCTYGFFKFRYLCSESSCSLAGDTHILEVAFKFLKANLNSSRLPLVLQRVYINIIGTLSSFASYCIDMIYSFRSRSSVYYDSVFIKMLDKIMWGKESLMNQQTRAFQTNANTRVLPF